MISRTICHALPVVVCLAGPGAWAGDAATITYVTEITEDPATNLTLDWAIRMYATAGNLFVVSHRDGRINTFSRDTRSGAVRYLGFQDVASQLHRPGTHLDAYPVLSSKNILYATGEWTHAHGNEDSLGLSWYRFEPKDVSLTLLGNVPCDAGALRLSPDGQSLYLSAWWSGAIYQIDLDANGMPTMGAKIVGKGLGTAAECSADGRFLYSLTDNDLGWVEIKMDGTLAYGGSCDLAPLHSPGGLRSKTVAISPDGRHAYAWLWTYTYSATARFDRDAKTGALTFSGKLEVDPGMQGVNQVAFATDGRTAYYSAGPETPGSCIGWFTRDPETGTLTFGGKAPHSPPSCHFVFCHDSGTIYAAGYWSTKSFWIFSTK